MTTHSSIPAWRIPMDRGALQTEQRSLAGCSPWHHKELDTPERLSLSFHRVNNEGFPGGSVVKNPPANARDLGSIPGSGRSTGEGIGYPLQYSWASLVAQLVKNLPAMRETWV